MVQVHLRPRCLVVSSNKCLKEVTQLRYGYPQTCTVGQGVKTLPFHGSSRGSSPLRCIVGNDKGDSQPLNGVQHLEVALVVTYSKYKGMGALVGLRCFVCYKPWTKV